MCVCMYVRRAPIGARALRVSPRSKLQQLQKKLTEAVNLISKVTAMQASGNLSKIKEPDVFMRNMENSRDALNKFLAEYSTLIYNAEFANLDTAGDKIGELTTNLEEENKSRHTHARCEDHAQGGQH